MITLENILIQIYPLEDATKVEKLLKEFNFYDHLVTCISAINNKLKNESEEINQFGIIQIGAVASSLLSGTNERLRQIKGDENYQNIEQAIADISQNMISYTLRNVKSDKGKVVNQLSFALHETCTIFNYNEDILFESLGFRQSQHYSNILNKSDVIKEEIQKKDLRFYKWIGKPEKKEDFIALFRNKKLVIPNRKKNLHKLFDSHTEPLYIEFNPDKARLLMTLFYHLKNNKDKQLIKVTGKEGFYTPLKQHGLDFQKNILGNKTPSMFNDVLVKNQSEWAANTKRIEAWLEKIH